MSLLFAVIASVLILLDIVSGSTELVQFENFMLQFNKTYKSREEFQHRLSVFSKNLEKARLLQRQELGTAEYGVTMFSDLTDEEFSSYHFDPKIFKKSQTMKHAFEATVDGPAPKTCDWRKKGVISEVKNQGQSCRSCWAFAAVGNIEAQWGIAGEPKNLSVQQVIDCSVYKEPCQGGYAWDAFVTVQQEGGLSAESKYPYIDRKGNCKRNLKVEANIKDFEILQRNEKAMASHLAYRGTLTVVINKAPLRNYQRGIINPIHTNCNQTILDHMALIIGYGGGNVAPFWILKNSWGKQWGEKGYFKLARGKNACGIIKYPVTAIVDLKKEKKKICPP